MRENKKRANVVLKTLEIHQEGEVAKPFRSQNMGRPLSQPQRQPQRIRSQSQTHVSMNEETNHLHGVRSKTARAVVAHLTLNRPIWG